MKAFRALPTSVQDAFTRAFAYGTPPRAAEWADLFHKHWRLLRRFARRA
jgi:hypothetical protein